MTASALPLPAVRARLDAVTVAAVPALIALLLGLWSTGRPSLWTDEIVTVDVARRSREQIWALLGNVDAVHGLYYLLMHEWTNLAGTSPTALRLPSVLATVLTAAAVGLLGRALSGPVTGLVAGLVFAALPVTSQYALEARSYALVAAAATVTTLVLVHALSRPAWFAAYALGLTVVGALHLFAVLLVPAHLVIVLGLRPAGKGRGAVFLAWVAATGAAGLALTPLALVAAGQRGAVEWIRPPDAAMLVRVVTGVTGGVAATALAAALCGWALARSGAGRLLWVAVPWLVVPPVALLGLSLREPMFVGRYVLYAVPALALLIAAGAVSRPRAVTVPAAVALLLACAVAQPAVRRPDSKWHDVTPVVRALSAHSRPGDGFLLTPSVTRGLAAAYPNVFAPLTDLALRTPAARRASLRARDVRASELARRLRSADRVWLIRRLNGDPRTAAAAARREQAVRRAGLTTRKARWTAKRMRLTLYERPAHAARVPHVG
ncbi:glycosyltransferase family 39 protein [Actinomadura flavalba]|uniref:glycosyltransferase family 39 protein n=1 Tax=Actinomadura flavalba TaxID=1120938 RepID=UPI00036ACD27|nr:glycosyltransferase family 39 protein [Actinomadura flavalba]